jgi:drug/metabolite transporter (DMT)-like permease
MAGVGFAIAAAATVVCGYLLFYWLLGSLGAGRVSMLQWTQLLVATAESVLLIRIRPGWESAAGAALIVMALVRGFSKGEAEQGVILKITQE